MGLKAGDHRATSLAHLLRMLVESALNGFENMLMLPSCDPSLFGASIAVLPCQKQSFTGLRKESGAHPSCALPSYTLASY